MHTHKYANHNPSLHICLFTGYLDAALKLDRSLTQPIVGGDMRFSRGTAFLFPQGGQAERSNGGSGGTALSGGERGSTMLNSSMVSKAFTALTARKDGGSLSRSLSRLELQVRVLGDM